MVEHWGTFDILINIAGGNIPGATSTEDQTFFDMQISNWEKVTQLNINGTVYPSLVFGKIISKQKTENIINVSSMTAFSAITRVPGYSLLKASISNFTQWLSTEMALKFGENIRVIAIAPQLWRLIFIFLSLNIFIHH